MVERSFMAPDRVTRPDGDGLARNPAPRPQTHHETWSVFIPIDRPNGLSASGRRHGSRRLVGFARRCPFACHIRCLRAWPRVIPPHLGLGAQRCFERSRAVTRSRISENAPKTAEDRAPKCPINQARPQQLQVLRAGPPLLRGADARLDIWVLEAAPIAACRPARDVAYQIRHT